MTQAKGKITGSSTAEYFAKNLQQVGFSSPTKAVLTTLKEAVDNSLDACEEASILPEIIVEIEKVGTGTIKNTDLIRIRVEDNGPGLDLEDAARVFGEYLASSKFGRGRCSRGQQGIGISAATTWAQLTTAKGANIITKTSRMRSAISAIVEVDIKNNRGVLKNKKSVDWKKKHGLSVEFLFDGRIQLQGEGGLMTYLSGTALVNPHLSLKYKLIDQAVQTLERVSETCPEIPEATSPHPHTMKLGEFIAHSHLFGKMSVESWLKKGFSRISDPVISDLVKNGVEKLKFKQSLDKITEADFKKLFTALQKVELKAPTTRSVMRIGEESLAKSIWRLGEVDFFSVVSRKPTICDAKPVNIEVAMARLKSRTSSEEESPSSVLRFANRVPLQFDKAGCAMFQGVTSVNWKAYGLQQPKDSVPVGPYVIAVSLVSPFIKFKNASKETVDASDELVEEIRRALIQAGQRLSRHIRREKRQVALEEKIQHIEQFGPILVDVLARITNAPATRKKRASEGLLKLLARDLHAAKTELKHAVDDAKQAEMQGKIRFAKEMMGAGQEEKEETQEEDQEVIDVNAEEQDTTKETEGSEASDEGKSEVKTKSKKAPKKEKAPKEKPQKVKTAAEEKTPLKKKTPKSKKLAKTLEEQEESRG